MAEIVLGAALSHSPQLTAPPTLWHLYEEYDADGRFLLGPDCTPCSWQALADHHGDRFADRLDMHAWDVVASRCHAALDSLAGAIAAAAPDVLVVIGDDQLEMFTYECLPAFAVYCGPVVRDEGEGDDVVAAKHPLPAAAARAFHGAVPEAFAVPSDLGLHIVDTVTRAGFDVTQVRSQPGGRGLGHAFTFPRRRLIDGTPPPILPVFVNTYYPPNQPGPARCVAFGHALAAALRTWPGDTRVAVLASGGLSHLTIDEELDRRVLDALAAGDIDDLAELPRERLQAGTSEILNWVTLGAVLTDAPLTMRLVDYVPSYRTRAGTGVGMAFATWQRDQAEPSNRSQAKGSTTC